MLLDGIRSDIARLITEVIGDLGEDMGRWEKFYLVAAIAELHRNAAQLSESSDMWLRLCLVSLNKALVRPGNRDEDYAPFNDSIDRISTHELLRYVREF